MNAHYSFLVPKIGKYNFSATPCEEFHDFINTYLLPVQHKLRFPTSQELPGGYTVFQFALSKTLK